MARRSPVAGPDAIALGGRRAWRSSSRACASAAPPSKSSAADPAKDKLAQILQRGTLVGYAELDYPPQSIRVEGATRDPKTKCQPNRDHAHAR